RVRAHRDFLRGAVQRAATAAKALGPLENAIATLTRRCSVGGAHRLVPRLHVQALRSASAICLPIAPSWISAFRSRRFRLAERRTRMCELQAWCRLFLGFLDCFLRVLAALLPFCFGMADRL